MVNLNEVKMELIEPGDIIKSARIRKFGGENAAKFIMLLTRIDKINKIYKRHLDKSGLEFIDSLIEDFEIKFHFNEDDFARIPKTGPFVVVANHPFGGIDGILLLKLIRTVRPDFKLFPNYLLERFQPINDLFIRPNPLDPSVPEEVQNKSFQEAKAHIEAGNCLGMFPAGEISSYNTEGNIISDQRWRRAGLMFLKDLKVPIVPVFFQGANSRAYHLLGLIHPILKTVKLPSEFLNKKNKLIHVRFGFPIILKKPKRFNDIIRFGGF